jgi:hypothetical protein
MTSATTRPVDVPDEATFRYGAVLLIVLALVVFEIVAPAGNAQRAIAVALAGAALLVSVATWRTRSGRQGLLTLLVGAGVVVLVVGAATGVLPPAFEAAAVAFLVVAIPATLVRGLVRLVAERGATLHAIAGALALYLMLGLLFASLIGFVVEVQDDPYFAQGDVSNGDRVYYSFTVLTTTGFGDYTAATAAGHALAVLEMLAGQLFLVTVIGVLIGHYVRRASDRRGERPVG